ncbi:hypothetical protein D3C78_1288100 [compost metagenome]
MTVTPHANGDADQQRRNQRAKQNGEMLDQRVVKNILAIGILFQQRKRIQLAAKHDQQGQDPDLRIKQPAPKRLLSESANRIATAQKAKGYPQPQSTAD